MDEGGGEDVGKDCLGRRDENGGGEGWWRDERRSERVGLSG